MIIGAEVFMANQLKDCDRSLPFYLDDLKCSGSESNLLECLPNHNCEPKSGNVNDESACVRCLRKGKAVYSKTRQLQVQCVFSFQVSD